MTRADAVAWLNAQNGKALDYDNAYSIQCFDFFNYYYQYITGRNPYGDGYGVVGAKDIWTVPTSRFTKVANNPNDANQTPSPGDILIYGVGTYGHVNVCLSADANGVTTIGQNENSRNDPAQILTRSWATVVGNLKLIGWLSFNGFTANAEVAYNQRVVGANGVHLRDKASTAGSYDEARDGEPGEVLTFKGYVHGENFAGNDIWFVGAYSSVYCWSGAFTNTSASGLPDVTPQAPVVVTPPVVTTLDKVIDVSSHNTITDYATVIDHVRGAIAKAGHTGKSYGGGALNNDPKFLDFKKNFGNKLVGAYWYAYCSLDPITEADNFIKAVGDVPANFTYWLDIEETNEQTNAQINEWCIKFAGEVDKLTNKVCGFYMNRNWFNNYITTETKGTRPIWLAHYDTPQFSNPVPHQVAHQYTSTGKVTGYEGNLDINYVRDEFFTPTVIEKPVPPVIPEPPVVPEKPPIVTPPIPPVDTPSTTLYETILKLINKIIEWLKGWKK